MNLSITGLIYKTAIDPILHSVHTRVQSLITGNKSVLDVACGTGSLTFLIATKAQHVVGIDKSDAMINTANKSKQKQSIKNVEFLQADATKTLPFKQNEFDTALISMGLHQFPLSSGYSVLEQMKNIASELIILDYAVPLPDNWASSIVRFFEILGGAEHYTNFKSYIKNGGINALINRVKLIKTFELTTTNKIFLIIKCRKKEFNDDFKK
jgi:SAM-dependent methyltransferase